MLVEGLTEASEIKDKKVPGASPPSPALPKEAPSTRHRAWKYELKRKKKKDHLRIITFQNSIYPQCVMFGSPSTKGPKLEMKLGEQFVPA